MPESTSTPSRDVRSTKNAPGEGYYDAVVKNFSVAPEVVTVEIVESEPNAKAKGGVLFSEMKR